MKTLHAVAALLVTTALPMTALADVAPPDGIKRVGFSFTVAGVSAAKDHALVAFPCGTSNGAPQDEMAVISEGASVPVGRRGGECALYAIKKADLEAFTKADPMVVHDEAKLGELFKSNKVVACTGSKVTPDHELPDSDPRSEISQTLKVSKLDDTGCIIAAADVTPTASPTSTATPEATSSTTNGPPPVSPGGCGSCSTTTAPFGAAGVASISLLGMLVVRSTARRSKRRRAASAARAAKQ